MVGILFFFFFQAEDGIRDVAVTGVQTCALPISHCGRMTECGMRNAECRIERNELPDTRPHLLGCPARRGLVPRVRRYMPVPGHRARRARRAWGDGDRVLGIRRDG